MKFFIINNKKKFLIFAFFTLVLFFVSYNYFNFNENLIDVDSIYYSKSENDFFITGVLSSKNAGVYNKIDGIYYFSSGTFDINNFKIISPYKVRYLVLSSDDNFYKLLAYSEKYYKEISIKVLDIPIMSVSSIDKVSSRLSFSNFDLDDSSSDIYTDVYVEFMGNDKRNNFVFPVSYSTGKIRFRGATRKKKKKKSYKLELDSKTSFAGMDSDDDWILDALYTDESKIRNILSSQIWNLINDNQKIQNDLHGKFIDNEMILENFELKKYNSDSLNNFIRNMRQYYISRSYESIDDSFYIENYLNYRIFISLICAMDNISKNQYYSMDKNDSKILITPWDMDLTFGLDYSSSSEIKSIHKFNNYNDSEWLGNYALSD